MEEKIERCSYCNGAGNIENPVLWKGIGGGEVFECKECNGTGMAIENYGIKIQCPDCGSIFILNEFREYFCKHCKRIYFEAEIRERCGL